MLVDLSFHGKSAPFHLCWILAFLRRARVSVSLGWHLWALAYPGWKTLLESASVPQLTLAEIRNYVNDARRKSCYCSLVSLGALTAFFIHGHVAQGRCQQVYLVLASTSMLSPFTSPAAVSDLFNLSLSLWNEMGMFWSTSKNHNSAQCFLFLRM